MSHHHIETPVDSASLARLNAGDTVTLSGKVFTCRPLTYDRLLDPVEGGDVRLELKRLEAETVFHCGPLVRAKAQDFEMIAMVPMPSWLAGLERIDRVVKSIGLKIIIGKGALDGLSELCRSAKCIHLVCAGNYNEYASRVTRVLGCRWPELGLPEAMWIVEVEEFGPFIVDTDTNGKSLYQNIDAVFRSEAASLLEELDIDLTGC